MQAIIIKKLIELFYKYWKEIATCLALLLIVTYIYNKGYESAQDEMREAKERAERRYDGIAAEQEKELSKLRDYNNQLKEKVRYESKNDSCDDSLLSPYRLRALTELTRAK